jgi:hypothetical protein
MAKRQFPCNSCGADLLFLPGSSKMACPYCGSANELEVPAEAVVEHDYLSKMRELEECPNDADLVEVKEVDCGACGAKTTLGTEVQAGSCPFCDTPFVSEPHSEKVIKPHALLPFKIDSKEGMKQFESWVSSRWFAPNKLKEYARQSEKLQGIYLAHWTYDTTTSTDYSGSRGEHYYVTESYNDSEGNRKTRQVRKTRWYPVCGHVYNVFDDILIVANDSLPRKYTKELEPWDLHELVPFADEYLSGFKSEHYSISLRQGFDMAKDEAEPAINQSIRRDIGGDEQRVHNSYTDWNEVSFKHILLPVWVSAYRFHDEVYRVVINARTGEVQGERPYSWVKITLAVLASLILIAIIVVLFNK